MNPRHPEMPTARAPRIVAVIAALLVTATLFDGVASIGGLDNSDVQIQNSETMFVQAETPVVQ